MNKATIQANRVINKYRDMTNQFYALKGILCMDHGADYDQCLIARQFINGMAIAKRLDALCKGEDTIGPLFYE